MTKPSESRKAKTNAVRGTRPSKVSTKAKPEPVKHYAGDEEFSEQKISSPSLAEDFDSTGVRTHSSAKNSIDSSETNSINSSASGRPQDSDEHREQRSMDSDENRRHASGSPKSEVLGQDWEEESKTEQQSETPAGDIAAQKSQDFMEMQPDGDLADNHRYARHTPSSGSGLAPSQASPHLPLKSRTKGSAKRSRSASRAENHQPTNR